MKYGTKLTTLAIVLLLGCGGKLFDDGDGGDAGQAGSGSSSGGTSSGFGSAGAGSGFGSAGSSGSVGSGSGAGSSGVATSGAPKTGSGSSGTSAGTNVGGVTLACTGAASCPKGDVCCFSFGTGTAGSACQKTCAAGGFQLCTANSECTGGDTCQASPFGQKYCQAPADAGGPPPRDAGRG